MAECEFCGEEILPGERVMFAISGWEEPRARGGANQIHLRHRLGREAHARCVEDAKPRQVARRRTEGPSLDLGVRARARAR